MLGVVLGAEKPLLDPKCWWGMSGHGWRLTTTLVLYSNTFCRRGEQVMSAVHSNNCSTILLVVIGGLHHCRGASLIQCEPLTGRTHQIRVHLAHRGHPIVGDDVYGLVGPWIARHALHAAALTVRHPRSGTPLRIEAPLPQDFRAALEALGLQQLKGV